jgi:hypothetical protein
MTVIGGKWLTTGNQRGWQLCRYNPDSGTLSQNHIGIQLGDPNDGTLEYMGYYDAVVAVISTWYQLAFTFASGTLIFYINGKAVTLTTRSGYATPPATLWNSTQALAFANTTVTSSGQQGMSAVCSGSPVLTATEIADNYNIWRNLILN